MASTTENLYNKGLTHCPKWMKNNIFYETMMGSISYGCSTDTSDIDIYGWAIPPRELVFPHLTGEIMGFGKQLKRFEQYQEHHIPLNDKVYDISIYSIVKYFQLCMENNPNMIDSMFVPDDCILHITRIGQMVREKRKIFLHKGCTHKFKGYAYQQLHKVRTKNPDPESKRRDLVDRFGFDTKFASHCIRLLQECEQILITGDIDLRQISEQLKAIRRGEVKLEEIEHIFTIKEAHLEKLYVDSKAVPMYPPEKEIKDLLLSCMEDHYGSLSKAVVVEGKEKLILDKLKVVMDDYYDN